MSDIKRIPGGLSVDDRGSVSFVNEFSFVNVKRFYHLTNFSTETIRAFHGHKHEAKYVYVVSGSAIVAGVKLDNFESPSKTLPVERFIQSAKKPEVIFIPEGYANGIRAIESDTHVIIFSTATLEASKDDDYRYPADYWGSDVWEVLNR